MKGVDYSWSRPGGRAIKAAGFDFVMRYVPYVGDGRKGLTQDEAADLRANGLAIGMVFESVGERHLDGYAAGAADATLARDALAALGFPESTAIYFAVDFDAQPRQFAAIDDYQHGAADVLGAARVGVYGSYAVVAHCHAAETAAWYWQTYAWSRGQNFPARHVYQYSNGEKVNGADVDFNEANSLDGLWTTGQEDELSDADRKRLDDLEAFRAQLLKQLFDDDAAPLVDAYVEGTGNEGLLTLNDIARRLRVLESGGATAASGPTVNVKQIYDDMANVLKAAGGSITQAGQVRAGQSAGGGR